MEAVIIIMNYYRCKRILIFKMKYNMYNVHMHVNISIVTIMYNGFIIVYMCNSIDGLFDTKVLDTSIPTSEISGIK